MMLRQLHRFTTLIFALLCLGAAATCAHAQVFKTLHSFNGTDEAQPISSLIQASDGNLYGTTTGFYHDGNILSPGTVFRITPGGALTTLYRFDGIGLASGLIQASDGKLYGYTGDYNPIVYRITLGGALTTFYTFDGTGVIRPSSRLIQAGDGNFYGTSGGGGAYGYGAIFRLTLGGALTILHSFNFADGATPTGLTQASDGNLYGATTSGGYYVYDEFGGIYYGGTVFRISLGGEFTTIHSFDPSMEFAPPSSDLIQASDGNLYGTIWYGSAIYRITLDGVPTYLHLFNGPDGYTSSGGLIQGSDGNLYGTTLDGGAYRTFGYGGTVFRMSLGGVLTTLYSFHDDGNFGNYPNGVIQTSDGILYGTTASGGAFNFGTAFSLCLDCPNQAPVAKDQSVRTVERTTDLSPTFGTLTASDAEGDFLTFSAVSAPAHGTVEVHPNGDFWYTPTTGYTGTDSFTFVANDGVSNSNAATVSIAIAPIAPTALGATPAKGKITLKWTQSSTVGIAGNRVYRSTASGGPYALLYSSSKAITSYVDSSVTSGKTYYYVVTAVKNGQESPYSIQASAKAR